MDSTGRVRVIRIMSYESNFGAKMTTRPKNYGLWKVMVWVKESTQLEPILYVS